MQIEAMLCDAATVRENLLHVLGGGINRIWRQDYPAALMLDLALMMTMTRTEAQETHKLRIVVVTEDGSQLAEIKGEFSATPSDDLKPGELLAMPIVMPLRPVRIPKEGIYGVEILLDGQMHRSFAILAGKTPAPPET